MGILGIGSQRLGLQLRLDIAIWSEDCNWALGLRLALGIEVWDLRFGLGITIWTSDWRLVLGIEDRDLGFGSSRIVIGD